MKKFDKLKRTPWFSHGVKPLRPGVYERRYASGAILFSEWTGHNWLFAAATSSEAVKRRDVSYATVAWRGLVEKP
jgi:hypothetical protein